MLRNKVLLMCVVFGLLLTACGGSKPKTYTVGVMVEIPWLTPIYDNFKIGMNFHLLLK